MLHRYLSETSTVSASSPTQRCCSGLCWKTAQCQLLALHTDVAQAFERAQCQLLALHTDIAQAFELAQRQLLDPHTDVAQAFAGKQHSVSF